MSEHTWRFAFIFYWYHFTLFSLDFDLIAEFRAMILIIIFCLSFFRSLTIDLTSSSSSWPENIAIKLNQLESVKISHCTCHPCHHRISLPLITWFEVVFPFCAALFTCHVFHIIITLFRLLSHCLTLLIIHFLLTWQGSHLRFSLNVFLLFLSS